MGAGKEGGRCLFDSFYICWLVVLDILLIWLQYFAAFVMIFNAEARKLWYPKMAPHWFSSFWGYFLSLNVMPSHPQPLSSFNNNNNLYNLLTLIIIWCIMYNNNYVIIYHLTVVFFSGKVKNFKIKVLNYETPHEQYCFEPCFFQLFAIFCRSQLTCSSLTLLFSHPLLICLLSQVQSGSGEDVLRWPTLGGARDCSAEAHGESAAWRAGY